MAVDNFTPIDELVKNYNAAQSQKAVSVPAEVEPPKRQPTETVVVPESAENKELDADVKPYVEVHNDKLELDPELTQAGLQMADPNSLPSALNVKLPITDDKVLAGQSAPIYTSLRWLSTWGIYLLWKAHIQLKNVHGKVIRVFKP